MANAQGGSQTGTRDATYDIVAVLYHALQGAENCRTYGQDAGGDQELRSFFDEAVQQQRQLADRAKQLLKSQLARDTGQAGGSAFGFGQGGSSSQGQPASTGASVEGTVRP